jgi:hypothetical protein
MLQRKQVSHENINFYLKKLKNLDRYGQAFKKLWILWAESQPKIFLAPSAHLGASPPPPWQDLSVPEVASWVAKMAEINANEARHAYSGLLLIPGFESLRFSPLLKLAKRLWGGGKQIQ